jgi:hypothetical protein
LSHKNQSKVLKESHNFAVKRCALIVEISSHNKIYPKNANAIPHILQEKHAWDKVAAIKSPIKTKGNIEENFKTIVNLLEKENVMSTEYFTGTIIEIIAKQFRPHEIAKILPFQDGMRFADKLLTIDFFYDPWRHYAIELLYAIREHYSKEWNSSWHHDAYLGELCTLACRYDERYQAYQQALTKVSPAPPELLVAFASCSSAPGKPPVSRDEALKILIDVATKKPYKNVVRMIIKGCYKRFETHPQELIYWQNLYQWLDESKQDEGLPDMNPEFLNQDIKIDLSKIKSPLIKNKEEELSIIASKVFSTEKILDCIKGIAVAWEEDETVLWIYYKGKLDADTESLSLMAHTRIAAYYLKEYIQDNNKIIQINNSDKLPYHKNWVFLRK